MNDYTNEELERMTTEISPGGDGRWRHPDGTMATDDEAADAIWGTPTPLVNVVRDGMAKAMCAIEARSKAASLEEVQAGIQRWMRHRWEAERLIAELADYGFEVRPRGTVRQ